MTKKDPEQSGDRGISKVKLAIGAASLFLFIIGVKRTFRMEQEEPGQPPQPPATPRRGSRKP
ncbi:MAG TPA: hypothetical protein VFZ18_15090 [Longimicrobiaceae bacterium]